MDKNHISRTIKRLAMQVWEQLSVDDDLMIFGLNKRGYAVASELYSVIKKVSDHSSVNLFRFNVHSNSQQNLPSTTEKFVLIVDDVIFSGESMFSALTSICHSNKPDKIEVLSLIDRGHRTYPIHAELTGMNVPTKFGEHIEVILNDEELEQVVLFKNS